METKTIEKRAEQFAMVDVNCYCCEAKTNKMSIKMCPCRKACDSYNLYLRIAKEQREIDIQRAVEYLCGECTSKCEHICMMCNRKNELIKAMKGE